MLAVTVGLAVAVGLAVVGIQHSNSFDLSSSKVEAMTSAAASVPATAGGTPASAVGPAGAAGRWQPAVGMSWQWQLTGTLDLTVEADVFDLDAFTTTAEDVALLHGRGRHAICYVNVGAAEDFRPDHGRFPDRLLGKPLDGWPGERWLDIRAWEELRPIFAARFTMCRDKGFDAVEPDNVDGYANDSGFPLTGSDQLAFNRRVAELAHEHGLAAGLKNDVEQAADLVAAMDFAVNEECARYRECDQLRVFVQAGKPVFHVEYDLPVTAFCPVTRPLRFASLHKHLDLDAWRQTCP
ncbi:endo alpha-1,4 polygalactosaminidase [Rhizocola hellebori]|uniref:endo alpha-1,4 polygalactosaminidase n=1 Tax=Rhizocola hellebori TaxID=1392758 RepID=UPI001EF24BB2|nr:endo alpha-1,4 polygalactosaminidase [Rhizocola hellebori]